MAGAGEIFKGAHVMNTPVRVGFSGSWFSSFILSFVIRCWDIGPCDYYYRARACVAFLPSILGLGALLARQDRIHYYMNWTRV